MTTRTKNEQKTLLVGNARICRQIAYVLDLQDYELAEKLTKKNLNQYRDYQIYVCQFKCRSRGLVKLNRLLQNQLKIESLEDICYQIDEEYYVNCKGHRFETQNHKTHCKDLLKNYRHNCQLIRNGNLQTLRQLKPSELLLYVLQAKARKNIQCTRLEDSIALGQEIKGCCSVLVPFGDLKFDKGGIGRTLSQHVCTDCKVVVIKPFVLFV